MGGGGGRNPAPSVLEAQKKPGLNRIKLIASFRCSKIMMCMD